MESALETVNIRNESALLTCCLEYSIANNDIAYCLLQTLQDHISTITKKSITITSTCFDKSKSLVSEIFQNKNISFLPLETKINEIQYQNDSDLDDYSILFIDSVLPLLQKMDLKYQTFTINQLFENLPFNAMVLCCPLELTPNSIITLLEKKCNLILNLNQNALIITSTKSSGKVLRSKHFVNTKDNKCVLSNMSGDVKEEETTVTEAKTYAASINILNSTQNKAPELVYEEDEPDEDGDEDDDIDDDLNI